MKDLVIVCAGAFGVDIYDIALEINKVSPIWNIKGFLSDVPVDLKSQKIDLPILGSIQNWTPRKEEYYVIGISSPRAKEKLATSFLSKGAKFATLISPTAHIHDTAIIGEGSVVRHGASIDRCVRIGKFAHVGESHIGSLAEIGDFSTITTSVNVATSKIGKRVFIGSHSVVLGEIEDDAFVCVGSIVFSKVKSGQKVIGYPATRSPYI